MLKSIAEKLSLLLVTNKIISLDNRKFYIYGIELILYDTLIFLTILIISLITDTLLISLVFSGLFCLLRAYVGGYHCKTYLKCFCTSILIYISMIIINLHLLGLKLILSLILILFSLPVIFIYAPVEHINNPLSKLEKRKYKLISLILTTCVTLLYFVFMIFNLYGFSFAVSWVIFAIAILILFSKLGGKSNEKTLS